MTKSEFISTLAAATDMKKSDVERVVKNRSTRKI